MGSTLQIASIGEFTSIFVQFPLKGFYARGEPKEYDTFFLPSIWRGGHRFVDRSPIKEDTSFTVGEMESLKQCQKDVLSGKLVDEYFLKFIPHPEREIDLNSVNLLHWAALAQHYNLNDCHPTRLIDITRDPLVALYFAVSSHLDDNGFVYYFKDNFNEITPDKRIKWGGTYFDILEIELPGSRHPAKPGEDTLAVARTPFPNRRIEAT